MSKEFIQITDRVEFNKPIELEWNGRKYKRHYLKHICLHDECENVVPILITLKDGREIPDTNSKYKKRKFCCQECATLQRTKAVAQKMQEQAEQNFSDIFQNAYTKFTRVAY